MPLDAHPDTGVDLNEGQTLRPGEDYNAGLYLGRAPVTTLTGPDGSQALFVGADEFMAVQAERDTYRRTLGLVAAWMVEPGHDLDHLAHLLSHAGVDRAQGEAVLSIVNWGRAERARRALLREPCNRDEPDADKS